MAAFVCPCYGPAALLSYQGCPINVQGRHPLMLPLVLLRSALGAVNPGFGGQKFIEYQVEKVRKLRQMCDDAGVSPWIEVDGGISGKNAYKVCKVSLSIGQERSHSHNGSEHSG